MADQQFFNAVAAVWGIPAPGPANLFQHPAFVELAEMCRARFGGHSLTFSLSAALDNLGLHSRFRGQPELAETAESAGWQLATALSRQRGRRRYLCPLDLADDLPPLNFGLARLGQFSTTEISSLFDQRRLERHYPRWPLDAARLAQFNWLVVEEEYDLDPNHERRAVPILFADLRQDLGEVNPHRSIFPPAVEDALLGLSLLPWEQWSSRIMQETEWRGFRIPWAYTVDDDLCLRPARPPDPDTLTWQPYFVPDGWGGEEERERPVYLTLADEAQPTISRLDNQAWARLMEARDKPLFETPIAHFMVKAFQSEKMDEFLSHITAIEAAVGVVGDHKRNKRHPLDRHKLNATKRLKARIAGLLMDPAAGQQFSDLFDLRSGFVHGRGGLLPISTRDRVRARELARRIVVALVDLAGHMSGTREDAMLTLLDKGALLLGGNPGP